MTLPHIVRFPQTPQWPVLWPLYWFAQGTIFWGIFVLGSCALTECNIIKLRIIFRKTYERPYLNRLLFASTYRIFFHKWLGINDD